MKIFNADSTKTLSRLTEEEVKHNRSILWEEFCNESAVKRVSEIIKCINA